jgi:c-di-GMP-related signal transduction protein
MNKSLTEGEFCAAYKVLKPVREATNRVSTEVSSNRRSFIFIGSSRCRRLLSIDLA